MTRGLLTSILLICLAGIKTYGQQPAARFGKIKPADFESAVYSIDSNANAIVLSDIGSTEIVGNKKGSFSLEFKRFRRSRIIDKNGYDLANVEIAIYTKDDMEEELLNLKASTYNLENGKVVETKLDIKESVFKERVSKNTVLKKFTFPNVRPGSIIEFEYRLRSDFLFNLQPWEFQSSFPTLWSEYTVSIPEFLNYVTLTQGYQPYFVKEQKDKRSSFEIVSEADPGKLTPTATRTNFSAGVSDFRWAMKDVPALREESYTSTLSNHISRIEFQLSELREPVFVGKTYMKTWTQTTADLMERENFGGALKKDNDFINEILPAAMAGATTEQAAARNIFKYVRDNMSCTNYNRIYTDNSLRTVWKNRRGSEIEINLLLAAILLKAGLFAEPVILSTRPHGYAYDLYPLIDRFNYVVARVNLADKAYYLDASRPGLGFGKLSYECYNGHARVINSAATSLDLRADSLIEQKYTSIFFINDGKNGFSGKVQQTPGYAESYQLRNEIREKGQPGIISRIAKAYGDDFDVSQLSIDSLAVLESPVNINYSLDWRWGNSDIIYFNPMLGEGWNENPFKSAQRYYPVEMPYVMDQTYLLRMDIPEGYEIDELPKQIMVKLNPEDDGNFEYRISVSNGGISMRSRIRLKRAFFLPEEYDMLREFFNLIVKKHSEQIVFKKKK